MKDIKAKVEIEKEEGSKLELTITVKKEDFAKYWDKGFKKFQEVADIDGFRKGHAPMDSIITKYGEMGILESMADLAINDTYVAAIIDNKIKALGHPHIHVVTLEKDKDFVYHAHVEVYPEVTLPDYKAIAKDANKSKKEVVVADAEVDAILKDLQKLRIKKDSSEEVKEEDLVPLDDEFAKSFGDEFKSLEDLRNKVRTNMSLEKVQAEKEKVRTLILENLMEAAKVDIPEVLIESEIDRMMAQMKMDIERYGGTFAEYLTNVKKTEENLRKDFTLAAEKRAKSQLIIHEIAEAEKIKPSDEEVDAEVIRIMAAVDGADEDRAKSYADQMLTNEKTLQMLENLK
jgi:FKBP-type peptidyl-prolyl cis-trans isomerase (trigger factor)